MVRCGRRGKGCSTRDVELEWIVTLDHCEACCRHASFCATATSSVHSIYCAVCPRRIELAVSCPRRIPCVGAAVVGIVSGKLDFGEDVALFERRVRGRGILPRERRERLGDHARHHQVHHHHDRGTVCQSDGTGRPLYVPVLWIRRRAPLGKRRNRRAGGFKADE